MKSLISWLLAAWGANVRSALEYRGSFLIQAGLMLVNNLTWIAFWSVFFGRFGSVGGWTLKDMALCYGMVATGFGLCATLLGGSFELAGAISRGHLDGWMLRSRPVLLQALVGRMRLPGCGDLATGPVLLIATGTSDPVSLAIFVVGSISAALIIASYLVLLGTVAFRSGQSDDLPMFGLNALVTFGVYPPGVFTGPSRLLLYVVLPSGLMSWLPSRLLREPNLVDAGLLALGVAAFVAAAALAWHAGLRRYESGNLTLAVSE